MAIMPPGLPPQTRAPQAANRSQYSGTADFSEKAMPPTSSPVAGTTQLTPGGPAAASNTRHIVQLRRRRGKA